MSMRFFILILASCCSCFASTDYTHYQSPFSTRYASPEMSELFSLQKRHATWRSIWVALAEAEKDLGLDITQEQIDAMKSQVQNIDFDSANKYEKELKHDVMAHIYAFADQCPIARPIIHLGATSCLITDNADELIMREALQLIRTKLLKTMKNLSATALKYKDLPCLSYTHFQAAQPTTVGKRMTLWLLELWMDFKDLEYRLANQPFLGIKGATGTQASFLQLFNGDHDKVKALEKNIALRLNYSHTFPVSGQTYSRKQDTQILEVLSGICASAHKMSTDLRLLAHLSEIEEPFGKNQVGSSAMPYKRNPMENERICSLARYVLSLAENPKYTSSLQWFERTLDDSANRRLCIPEAFLATDTILNLLANIAENLIVYPQMIKKHLDQELPFLATESILMVCVQKGADRQSIHELIRKHSQEVGYALKNLDAENDLLDRLLNDPAFPLTPEEIVQILNVQDFIGRAPQQVEEFIAEFIQPLFEIKLMEHR